MILLKITEQPVDKYASSFHLCIKYFHHRKKCPSSKADFQRDRERDNVSCPPPGGGGGGGTRQMIGYATVSPNSVERVCFSDIRRVVDVFH